MKKLFIRIFVFGFFAYFILYSATKLSFLYEYEIREKLPSILFESSLLSIAIAGIFAIVLYITVRHRFRYIEKKSIEKPDFYVQKECYIPISDSPVSFENLKEKIKNKWVLTFVDTHDKVIKFRTKVNLFTWGTGCYLRYDEEIGALNLISFPVGADLHGSKRSIEKIKNKIVQLCA